MSRGLAAWSLRRVPAPALPQQPVCLSLPTDKRGSSRGVSRGVSQVLPAPGSCPVSLCPGAGRVWAATAGSTGAAGGASHPRAGRPPAPGKWAGKPAPWPARRYCSGAEQGELYPRADL